MKARIPISHALPLGLALAVGLAASLAAPAGAAETVVTERFFANAVVTGGFGAGSTAQIQFNVSRWSTDEERQELLAFLREEGPKRFTRKLRRQEPTGWVRTAQSLRWDLRYARDFRDGDRRRIVLATDRPVGFGEAYRGSRSLDYNTTLILLELDAEGKGSGRMLVGAELVFDEEANQLTVTGASSRPVTLNNVRKR